MRGNTLNIDYYIDKAVLIEFSDTIYRYFIIQKVPTIISFRNFFNALLFIPYLFG